MGTMTPAELAWSSLDRLRKHGHIKSCYEDTTTGKVCLMGAIGTSHAWLYGGVDILVLRTVMQTLTETLFDTATELYGDRVQPVHFGLFSGIEPGSDDERLLAQTSGLINFNNHERTTAEEVEILFEKTAIKLDEVLS